MITREMLKDIKYEIADKLFKKDMDEAFEMGIREGATFATRKINFEASLQLDKIQMTKTEKKGYLKALQVIEDMRKEIKDETGAMFL